MFGRKNKGKETRTRVPQVSMPVLQEDTVIATDSKEDTAIPVEERTSEILSASSDSVSQDSAVESPSVEAPSVDGSSIEGLTVEAPSVEGSSIEGLSVEALSVEETSLVVPSEAPATTSSGTVPLEENLSEIVHSEDNLPEAVSSDSIQPSQDKVEKAIIYSSIDDIDPDILSDADISQTVSRIKEKETKESFVPNDIEPIKLDLSSDSEITSDSSITKADKTKSSNGFAYIFIASIIVILVVGFIVFTEAGIKDKFQSPLSINNHAVASDEFSFMYHYVLIENGVDVFAPGTKEMLEAPSDDINYSTNREYFLDITAKQMQTSQLLYDDAIKHGLGIEDSHFKRARAYVDWLDTKAKAINVSLDTYIKGVFGNQVDENCVVNTLAKKYFTEDYASNAKLVELQATSEQATEAYNNNKNAYDLVSYKVLRITYEQREEAFIATATLHANQIILDMNNDSDRLEEVASEYFSGEAKESLLAKDSTLVSDSRYSDFDHIEFRDWLFDPARTSGECTLFTDEDGFPIILCFVERKPQSVPLRNVEIIEVTTRETDENGEGGFSLGEAQRLSQEIYDYIKDTTTLSSVENLYTDEVLDGTITVTLSKDTYPGKFSETIDSWVFDPNRASGNKEILESENGFYVIYFIEESQNPEWYDRVNSFIRMNNYQAFLNEMESEYSYKFNQSGLDQIFDVP